jgi:hypothetical protein
MMNTIKAWAIDNRLTRSLVSRILTACLLGLLLTLNVACTAAPKVSRPAPDDIYSQGTQENRGAMGERDQRLDENNPRAEARARELIDTAKKNAANPNKLDNLSKQAQQSAEELPGQLVDGVKRQKDDFVKGTERGAKNLKENLKAASKEIPNIVKEATGGAIEKIR